MRSPRLSSRKLALAFFSVLAVVRAQEDPVSLLTPDVIRVGTRLACRCGTCRNTVADCAMLHCSYCDPKRHQIYDLKSKGMSDDDIVNSFVKADGIVVLASPPAEGAWPIMSWVMPGIVLLLGFCVYSIYVRRNRKAPEVLAPADQAVLDRFKAQIARELDEK